MIKKTMMTSERKMNNPWLIVGLILVCSCVTLAQKQYDMDEQSTCGRTIVVDDNGVTLQGRGDTSPSNPPTRCVVQLISTYREEDGTNGLQVEAFKQIKDCSINVDLFNGHKTSGAYLTRIGCGERTTDIHYSSGREITVRLTRPDRLIHNEYNFRLLIKPFKKHDAMGTHRRTDTLSVGAIIGIALGCLLLVALIILFCWCCCTGRLGNRNIMGRKFGTPAYKSGVDSSGISIGQQKRALDFEDPIVWNTAAPKYEPGPRSSRNYQKGVPRNNMSLGRRFEKEANRQQDYYNRNTGGDYFNQQPNRNDNNQQGHVYEPYNTDTRQGRASEGGNGRWQAKKKETNIDDVFESDSGSEKTEETCDDATLQKRPAKTEVNGSPKSKRRGDIEIPEEQAIEKGSPQLQRYLSMDLESHPDHDTITSQLHINAGVRASVEDDLGGSPSGSLRKKKKTDSPLSRRRGDGRGPDQTVLPPEAFEPIFTKPITGIDYQSSRNPNPYGQVPGYPGGVMPYGLIPAGAFMPGPPGTQTYAYAYQTAPQYPGMPGQQGAWVVQNTPTAEGGKKRTAYAVEQTLGPSKDRTPERRRKNADPFRRTGNRNSWGRDSNRAPDMSMVARGAAPPDPGQGQRSIEMKSGTDPDTGFHTTEVVWRDTVPDATDPKPGENPQVTRKTVTRVTTKSGYGDMPPSTALLSAGDEEPEFLSPSRNRHNGPSTPQRSLMPAAATPGTENVAFYTGAGTLPFVEPPERSSTPTSAVINHPTYNRAIRDRIPIDSNV